jgi:hypothetical protein
MALDWRRVVASIASAVIFTLVVSGDTILETNGPGPIAVPITMAVVAVIFYRAAPGFQDRWRTIRARGMLRPTPQRVAGTVLLASLLTIAFLSVTRLVLPLKAIDGVDVIQYLLIFGFGVYLSWRDIERKWQEWWLR